MNRYLLYACLLIVVLIFCPYSTYSTTLETHLIFYNDLPLSTNTPILSHNQDLYVNLRQLASQLNLHVFYNKDTRTASVSSALSTFTYHLDTQKSYLNNQPTLTNQSPLLIDNLTYVPAKAFASLFSFHTAFSEELFIINKAGQEIVDLDYLTQPLTIDTYDYIPVTTLLINDATSADLYTNSSYSAAIRDIYVENNITYLTLQPFTEVQYPAEYSTLTDLLLLNFSPTLINLPLSQNTPYSYLTYNPNIFSTETTSDSTVLLEHIKTHQVYLIDVITKNGSITSIQQIYTP